MTTHTTDRRAGDALAPLREMDDLTAEWMTAALDITYPGTVVTRLTIGDVRHGSESTVRVMLGYNRVGHEHRLPPTMYVKGQLTGREAQGILTPMGDSEARFMQEVAPLLPGLNIPACHFATVAADRRSTIVMEDLLARNVTMCAAGTTVGPGVAMQLAEQFAQLHGLWFDAPELGNVDWLVGSRAGDVDVEQLATDELGIFGSFKEGWWARRTALPHCEFLPPELKDRTVVKRALVNKYLMEDELPNCVIHGDPHLGNMFLDPDGRPGLYDWSPMVGRWGDDLNYAIIGSLSVDDRRVHEQDILRHYLTQLAMHGGPTIPWADAWLSWRRQTIHGFMYMLCSPRQQPEELIAVQTERFGAAAIDHDMLGALEA